MLNIIKAIGLILTYVYEGTKLAFNWYRTMLKESKWYIIPLIIDVVLIPLKFMLMGIICLRKNGRNLVIDWSKRVAEDMAVDIKEAED